MSGHVRIAMMLLALASAGVGSTRPGGLESQGDQSAAATFSARSELVVLHVVVKDRKGTYVSGLGPEAFSVLEDGRPQAIQFFVKEDAPVTVGLLIDGSGSMLTLRERLIAAAGAFADTSNPEDEIFALVFNETIRSALSPEAPFTGDGNILRNALGDAITARGLTAVHDAVLAGLDYAARGHHPRKVLVLVSDGGDNASSATFDEILKRVERSNIVVYTVGLIDPLEREAKPAHLRQLAAVSGGEALMPDNIEEISSGLRQIATDIRNTYTIGYVPTSHETLTHRLRVRVHAGGRRDLVVRTRQGYATEE